MFEEKLLQWLQAIEDSGLEGRMKAWILNFHLRQVGVATDGARFPSCGCGEVEESHPSEISKVDWSGQKRRTFDFVSL